MFAILVDENKDLVWSEVKDPSPTVDQVVIDIKAAALNRADLLQRAGSYPPPPGWPQWMGLEVAGVISYAPAGSRWKLGDPVCALLGGGGYAQKVAVPQDMVLPIPAGLSFAEAACIPEAYATAWLNLCIEGGMQFGDTVFIQAGASGLGVAAVQLAKLHGAKVITTVGSEQKEKLVRQLGADVVINRRNEGIVEVLAKNPVDIALDCVAGPRLGDCIKTMRRGGRWIIIANLGGDDASLNMHDFLMRGVRLIGSTLRSRPEEMKAKILSDLEEKILPEFSTGRLKIIIHKTLSITQAEEAHQILRHNQNLGKVVLIVE